MFSVEDVGKTDILLESVGKITYAIFVEITTIYLLTVRIPSALQ